MLVDMTMGGLFIGLNYDKPPNDSAKNGQGRNSYTGGG